MSKVSTNILRLLLLVLIFALSLCSCDLISNFQTPSEVPDQETNAPPAEEDAPCGHYVTSTKGKLDAGCTSDGYTGDEVCFACEEVITKGTVIPAAHSYKDGVCSACGESDPNYTKPDDTHTHSYTAVVTAPTCTAEGFTTYTCSCKSSYVSDKTASLGHRFASGTCTVCGENDPNYGEPILGPFDYSKIPEYSGNHYVVINGNDPYFTSDEITDTSFEHYGELDSLNRATLAYACLGSDLFPTGTRPSLSYEPTGWVQKNYPSNVISTSQIYNRSHLISWALAGEGNNKQNLITGTPYFNQMGMQIFENQILDYIRETNNHVMYRVTPIYVGNELVARGALMEGWSVEDNGAAICFCVFMYNVQPGITINYATGDNYQTESGEDTEKKNTATLVTDISDIKAGDKIIIVSSSANYALSTTQNKNNRVAAAIEKDGNTVTFGDDIQIITVGSGLVSGTYSFAVDEGYLYSASSSANYLKTQSTLSENGSWKIEIKANGVATVKSAGSYTRNWLRFNSQYVLFSSYASGQGDICIYIVNE